jgi:hypothetical protein
MFKIHDPLTSQAHHANQGRTSHQMVRITLMDIFDQL